MHSLCVSVGGNRFMEKDKHNYIGFSERATKNRDHNLVSCIGSYCFINITPVVLPAKAPGDETPVNRITVSNINNFNCIGHTG